MTTPDSRDDTLPTAASLQDIASHYFFDVMAAEDEAQGCLITRDKVYGGPLFCCQWHARTGTDMCSDCRELQARIERYAVKCMTAALKRNTP